MVLALVGIRKMLDFIFTQRELFYLDDIMPSIIKNKNQVDKEETSNFTVCLYVYEAREKFSNRTKQELLLVLVSFFFGKISSNPLLFLLP